MNDIKRKRKFASFLRGATMKGKPRGATVLGADDHAVIIAGLRDFTPLVDIAAHLKVSRATLSAYIKSHEGLRRELDDRNESLIDLVEKALFDAATGQEDNDADENRKGVNVNAAIFLLERLGKGRGYSKRVDVWPSIIYNRVEAL